MFLVSSLLGGLAALPASSRKAVNDEVMEFRLPLGVKISEFLIRDYWYRRMACEITRGVRDPEARCERVLSWTRENIRRPPPEWPVLDDHILCTIIRGYGAEEQAADVFTTLSSYSGTPAFWGVVQREQTRRVLSFCFLNGRWTIWDATQGSPFRNPDGSLASVSELSRQPEMAPLASFFVPKFTRAQKQMPLPRIFFEAQHPWMRFTNKEEEFDPKIVFRD